MLPKPRREALKEKAANCLEELIDGARSESVRYQAAVAILRHCERADKLEQAELDDSPPAQPHAAAPQPLSENEITELKSLFPHLDSVRLARPGLTTIWRHYLVEGRAWRDHWNTQTTSPVTGGGGPLDRASDQAGGGVSDHSQPVPP